MYWPQTMMIDAFLTMQGWRWNIVYEIISINNDYLANRMFAGITTFCCQNTPI
jgi:hypothetical protein